MPDRAYYVHGRTHAARRTRNQDQRALRAIAQQQFALVDPCHRLRDRNPGPGPPTVRDHGTEPNRQGAEPRYRAARRCGSRLGK